VLAAANVAAPEAAPSEPFFIVVNWCSLLGALRDVVTPSKSYRQQNIRSYIFVKKDLVFGHDFVVVVWYKSEVYI